MLELNYSSELLHSDDIGRLDVFIVALDLLLELIEGDLGVLDDQVNLQLFDTVTNRNKLGSTPNQAILLNSTDRSLQSLHISFIICGSGLVASIVYKRRHAQENARNIPQGLTSIVTILLAIVCGFPAFFLRYSARRSSRMRTVSASSSSSSSLPNRSSLSSSSPPAAALGFSVASIASGPYAVYGLLASPASVGNSSSYDATCLYQRAELGFLVASGADLRALKQATSAWEGA